MNIKTLLLSLWTLLLVSCIPAGELVIKDGDSIAFMGDSLTQLGYLQKPNGYVHLVIEGLKQAGVNATPIPAGIGGNTTRHMLARIDKDIVEKKPVWMTLNSGINDTGPLSVEEFGANLAKIVDKASAAGIKVILMNTTIGAGENIESPDSLKRLKFCEEFKNLAKERNLLLVDLNTVMSKELTERKNDGVKGLKLTYDGTHLNGLGNQIVAAEILRTLGVSESDIAILRKRWDDYPFAVGMPELSVNDYLKLKAAADKNGKSADEHASGILTASMKVGTQDSGVPAKSVAVSAPSAGIAVKNGDKVAILTGQSFEVWSWSPSGYARLLTDELTKAGVKEFPLLFVENQKTEQMLANIDKDVISKKPVYALIIPGTADYNPWAEKNVPESFKKNITEIVEKLKAANIKTVIATSYAVNSNLQFPANPNVAEHNAFVRALAKEQGLTLIDFVKSVDDEAQKKNVPFDGSPAAKCLVNQMFTAELLLSLGFDEKKVALCRQAWLDKPGAIQLMPSVSVNTYEKLRAAAKASGKDVGVYMTEVLRETLEIK